MESSSAVRDDFLRQNGLLDDLDLLIEMDKAFSEFISSERTKGARQRKGVRHG